MLDNTTIQKLRDLPIEGVAERLGLEVKRHKSLCPFHDDSHPSLMFNVRKNTFRCYVCGEHGTTIDLVMKHLHKSFFEACKWLADENNIIVERFQCTKKSSLSSSLPPVDARHLARLVCQPYLNDEAKHFLYDERKIKPEVVKQLGLSSISSPVPMSGDLNGSWFNAPSLLIPYRDIDGKLISVQARYLGNQSSPFKGERGGLPRFQFPKGSRCSIFNLPVLKDLKEGDVVWITEGVSDCIAMLSLGKKAIAIPSATLLGYEDRKLLSSLSSSLSIDWHMFPDRDAPGERLFLDLREILPNIVHHSLLSDYKDFGEYYVNVLAC